MPAQFIANDEWSRRLGAYGAMAVTFIIFGLFALGVVITSRQTDMQQFNGLMETLKALVMVGAGYWLGSSSNSAKKDDTIAASAAALATSMPPPPSTEIRHSGSGNVNVEAENATRTKDSGSGAGAVAGGAGRGL